MATNENVMAAPEAIPSGKSGSLNLVDLAPELLDGIFSFCDRNDLPSLTLVSRHVGSIAKPVLYRHPILMSTSREADAFEAALKEDHNLPSYVRSLGLSMVFNMDDSGMGPHRLLAALARSPHTFVALRCIKLYVATEADRPMPQEVLLSIQSLPALTGLGLHVCIDDDQPQDLPWRAGGLGGIVLPQLTEVLIQAEGDRCAEPGSAADLCSTFPNVAMLVIKSLHFEAFKDADLRALRTMPHLRCFAIDGQSVWNELVVATFGRNLPPSIEDFKYAVPLDLDNVDYTLGADDGPLRPVPTLTRLALPEIEIEFQDRLAAAFDSNFYPGLTVLRFTYWAVKGDQLNKRLRKALRRVGFREDESIVWHTKPHAEYELELELREETHRRRHAWSGKSGAKMVSSQAL